MQPVSNDKRADIITAKQRNEPVKSIKRWFNVSDSTISRIWNKYLKTGSFLPIPYTGRKSDITPQQDKLIRLKIQENCDVTIEKLIAELQLNITVSGLSRHLEKMELSFKKRLCTRTTKNEKMSSKNVKFGEKIKKK
jgi:transposase